MYRMGSADKKTRKKRTRKITKPILPSPSSGSAQTSQNTLPSFLPDLTHPKSEQEELQELQKMMDAENDSDPPVPSLPKGPNPYLTESCLLCRCKKPENTPKSEAEGIDQNQLPLWVCSDCRKTVEEEDKRAATTMASLLVSMEQDLKLDPPSIPPLEPMTSSPSSPTSSSEPTTPNGTLCNCEACTERRQIEQEQEKESLELQKIWQDLRHVVRYVYREAGTGLGEGEGEENTNMPDVAKMKEHVHRLVVRDPHQLFQRLESQGREFVIEMKVRLLKQLTAGHKTPPQAKQFVAMLLDEYSNLCTAASTLASFLTELMDHLKRFNLTWELHNKHLFQSIIYTDPVVQNSLPMLITQLRLGAASKEAYHEDTYPNILHRYLKFDDEMSVISVVWRDCEQLIEAYNDEQTALKAKQKMLKEDWEFFKAQRKMLEEKVLKNMPAPQTTGFPPSAAAGATQNANVAHNLEAQLTETMRNILQGSKTTGDECLCPNCNRKRCPCDECSISHMITCGIINPEVAEQMPAHSSGYPHDPSRYIIDVTPPSMSSTSSSSGSESPITVDPERLTFPFDENFQLAEEIEEIPEDIEGKLSDSPDSDDETTADENDDEDTEDDEETEDDEGSSETKLEDVGGEGESKLPGVSSGGSSSSSSTDSVHEGERQQGDGQEKEDSDKENSQSKTKHNEVPCDCTHCTQASILQRFTQATLPVEDVGSVVTPQCQCHACLLQSGEATTSPLLPPQHLSASAPRPAALHLYPHIHGSNAMHPGMQNVSSDQQQIGPMQSLLRPHLYELHGMRQVAPKSFTAMHNKRHSGFNFDVDASSHEHLYNAFGDWDSSPFDSSKLNMFGSAGHKLVPNMTGSELLNAPPPLLTGNPFMNEINNSGCDTSLANLMKTSTVVQHCVSASKPLTTTTVTTSTEITTSIKGLTLDTSNTSVHNSFTDAHNKILKVSKALLNQQHQHGGTNKTKPQSLSPSSQSLQTPSTFTFGLPSPLNKNNLTTSPGLGTFSVTTSSPSSSYATASSPQPASSFSLSNAVTSPSEFCFKHTASTYSPQPASSSSFTASMSSSVSTSPTVSTSAPAGTSNPNHQLKLNPDFIRAAAALQKAISEQNAAQQQQQQQHNNHVPGMHNVPSGLHNFQNFANLNLQNFTAGLPQHSLLTCTHQFTPTTPNSVMQLAGANMPSVGMPTPQPTPVGLATSGLKLTNQQFQLPSHMTLPTQPVSSTGGGTAPLGVIGPQSTNTASSAQAVASNSNISVGTSTPTCNDPDCDGHHDNDNDSIDDSCSEKSSSTSTSNQKDGKYCDCCYCEFFGHTTPPTVQPSRNYPEMRERLRKRLKIKNERKNGGNPECLAEKAAAACEMKKIEPAVVPIHIDPPEADPMEQKGLDELVKFINGGNEEEQKKSTKAAKRARQKQRKAEERAAKEVAECLKKEAELKAITEAAEKAMKAHKQRGKDGQRSGKESKEKFQEKAQEEKRGQPKNSTSCKNLNKKKGKHKDLQDIAAAPSPTPESKLNLVRLESAANSNKVTGKSSKKTDNVAGLLQEKNNSPVITNGEGAKNCSSKNASDKVRGNEAKKSQDTKCSVSSQPHKNTPQPLQPATNNNTKGSSIVTVNGDINMNNTRGKSKKSKVSPSPQSSPRPGSANVHNNNKEGQKANIVVKPATNHVIQPNQPVCNGGKSNPSQSPHQNAQPSNNKTSAPNVKSVVQIQNQTNIQMSHPGNVNKLPVGKPIINHNPPPPPPPAQKAQQQNGSVKHQPQTIPPPAGKSPIPRQGVPLNRTILHATRTLTNQAGRGKLQQQQNKVSNSPDSSTNSGKFQQPPLSNHLTSVSAPSTPDQCQQRRGPNSNIQPSAHNSTHLNFEQRSVPSTPTKQPPPHQPNMGVQGKSRSEGQLAVNQKETSWPTTPKKNEEGHNSSGGSSSKNKKKTRRNKGGEEMVSVDEIFLPKPDPEHGDMDEFERELEEFKRFCNDSKPPEQREKLQVNVNLKDIFSKKKSSGLGCV